MLAHAGADAYGEHSPCFARAGPSTMSIVLERLARHR